MDYSECLEDHGDDVGMRCVGCVHFEGFVTSVTEFDDAYEPPWGPLHPYGVFGPDPPGWKDMNNPPDIVTWHATKPEAVAEMHRRSREAA